MFDLVQPGGLTVAFWVLLAAWAGSEVWLHWRHRLPSGATRRDRGSMLAVVASVWTAVALGFAAAVLLPGAAIVTGRTALFGTGLALMLLGLVVRWSATRPTRAAC